MTSQVYYRKWRPRTFQELVGQEHVTTTLRQAVKQGRIAHAYLFCGPRGTGKTTTARVLAKVLNCLDPQDGEPDNSCALCRNLDQGRSLDLIELDAASNRGIDEIRNIREKVNFSPMEGRYKVYIIDEAHMLTEAASNAFLKTLEEPPSHAVFVLCTTESHKILATIISRCQRFDFRRLPRETIVTRLRYLCDKEGIEAEPKALNTVALAASGSLRDAENLLEQLAVAYGSKVELAGVQELLGLGHSQGAKEFVTYLLMGNSPSALATICRVSREGADLRQVHRQALELLRGILMAQAGAGDTLDLAEEAVRELETLARKVPMSRVMRSLKALGEIHMTFDATSTLPLELAVVEVSLDNHAEGVQAPPTKPSHPQAAQSFPGVTPPRSQLVQPPASEPPPLPEQVVGHTSPATAQGSTTSRLEKDSLDRVPTSDVVNESEVSQDAWNTLVRTLSRHKGKRFNIGALLRDCKAPHVDNDTMILPFSHRSHLERMQNELEDPESRKAIEEALQQVLGTSYQVKLTLHADNASSNLSASATSHLVKAAMNMGGRILEERKVDE